MREILSLKNVSLIYHTIEEETLALKDISFTVNEGEFVSVIGPSGCGKTTILSLIAGLIKPTSGEILIDGANVKKNGSDIGYMLQKDQLLPWRTIYKNVRLGLEIKNVLQPQKIAYMEELLKKYGLYDFKGYYPYQLSGGMKQRAALIRTLAYNPKILLLDEPFSALDYQTRLNVCDDVFSIIEHEKKTAVLVTHDIAEAISMSDRIIVLTKRPALVKTVYETPFRDFGLPIRRREHPQFPKIFDSIWRDICDEKQ